MSMKLHKKPNLFKQAGLSRVRQIIKHWRYLLPLSSIPSLRYRTLMTSIRQMLQLVANAHAWPALSNISLSGSQYLLDCCKLPARQVSFRYARQGIPTLFGTRFIRYQSPQ
eukprot:scaffold22297_cov18-Tisochrysis_lutea.AAC.2